MAHTGNIEYRAKPAKVVYIMAHGLLGCFLNGRGKLPEDFHGVALTKRHETLTGGEQPIGHLLQKGKRCGRFINAIGLKDQTKHCAVVHFMMMLLCNLPNLLKR